MTVDANREAARVALSAALTALEEGRELDARELIEDAKKLLKRIVATTGRA